MKKLLLVSIAFLFSVPAFAQEPRRGFITTNGAATCVTAGSCVRYDGLPANAGAVGVQIVDTFTGTLSFERTADGSTYTAAPCTNSSGTEVTSATAVGGFQCSVSGFQGFQVRGSATITGAAQVTITPSLASAKKGNPSSGPGSGTVTSVATTSPITGGTITSTGTIACASCVAGPSSATDNHLAVFDGITGKLIKDGGTPIFKTATVTLNNAQIKALPTNSPITLVAGVAGKVLFPVTISTVFDWVSDFENISNTNDQIRFGWTVEGPYDPFVGNKILNRSRDAIGYMRTGLLFQGDDVADYVGGLLAFIANEFSGTIAALTPSGTAVGAGTYDIPVSMASMNTGAGINATFHIVNTAGSYVVTVPTVASKGSGFAMGDVITIDGGDIGGVTMTNDLTITIDTVATLTEDFTGGNAANTLTITTTYQEVPVP